MIPPFSMSEEIGKRQNSDKKSKERHYRCTERH